MKNIYILLSLMLFVCGSAWASPPENWGVTITGTSANIFVYTNAAIQFDEDSIYIGAFFADADGKECCAGYELLKKGKFTAITVYGEDFDNNGKPLPGLKDSTAYRLKVYLPGRKCVMELVDAAYKNIDNVLITAAGLFKGDKVSDLISLKYKTGEIAYAKKTFCGGEAKYSPQITASGKVRFSANLPGLALNPDTGEIDPKKSAGGTYKITFSSLSGECLASTETEISIDAENSQLLPSYNTCEGRVEITANTLLKNIVWSDGQKTAKAMFEKSGTYFFTAQTTNGCAISDTITVNVATRTPLALGNDLIGRCGAVTLDAGPGFAGYKWSNGEKNQKITVSYPGGIYVCEATNAEGCVSVDTIKVSIAAPFSVRFASDTLVSCLDSAVLAPNIQGTGNFTYFWLPTGENKPQIVAYKEQLYILEIKNEYGCSQKDTVYVLLNKKDGVAGMRANTTPSDCFGSGKLTVSGPNLSAYLFSIDGGKTFQASPEFAGIKVGKYPVVLKNKLTGCQTGVLQTAEVPVLDVDMSLLTYTASDEKCSGYGSISLEASALIALLGPLEYSIDGGGHFQKEAVFENLTAGVFKKIQIRNANGCTFEYPGTVIVNIDKKDCEGDILTPNAAQNNSFLLPCDDAAVFYRNGKLVYKPGAAGEWRGESLSGGKVPEGLYVVHCEGKFFTTVTVVW